jgi:pimeloyl-ACP methyl ester carboxylesterase
MSYKKLLLAAWYLVFQGCTSLLFFPDGHLYLTPSHVGLSYQSEYLLNSNGNLIHVWKIWKPNQKSASKALVQFHGNAQNMTSHFLGAAWFCDIGYTVFAFDYQGYGLSEGFPTIENSVQDGVMVLEYVRKQFEDVVVLGQSLGGALSIGALAQRPQLPVKALIIDSSFFDYREVVEDVTSRSWVLRPFGFAFGFLFENHHSPKQVLSTLRIPILVTHDLRDPVISFDQGKKLFRQIPNHVNKEFVTTDFAEHIGGIQGSQTLRSKIINFLKSAMRPQTTELQLNP